MHKNEISGFHYISIEMHFFYLGVKRDFNYSWTVDLMRALYYSHANANLVMIHLSHK